jgi:hypothetical protein
LGNKPPPQLSLALVDAMTFLLPSVSPGHSVANKDSGGKQKA